MGTVTAVDDDLMFRGRIFRREWNRGKSVSFPLYYHVSLSLLVDPAMMA